MSEEKSSEESLGAKKEVHYSVHQASVKGLPSGGLEAFQGIPKSFVGKLFIVSASLFVVYEVIFSKPLQKKELKEITFSDSMGVSEVVDVPYFTTKDLESERASRRSKAPSKVVSYPGIKKISRPESETIPPGTIGVGLFETGASDGDVRIRLKKDLTFNGTLYLQENTLLMGKAQSQGSRLHIQFNKAITQEGAVISIEAIGLDPDDQIAGIKGSLLGYYGYKLAGAAGLNFVSGVAEGLKQKQVVNGVAVAQNTTKNALLNGSSQAALSMASETMGNLKNRKPQVEVEKDSKLLVLFK